MGIGAGLLHRVVARGIDYILILAAVELLPKAGWVAGLVYILVSDGLIDGRSIGKRLAGLRVIGANGSNCTLLQSILRNSTLALGVLLWKLPLVGWAFPILTAGFEAVILIGSAEAKRIGDELAGTSVVDAARQSSAQANDQMKDQIKGQSTEGGSQNDAAV